MTRSQKHTTTKKHNHTCHCQLRAPFLKVHKDFWQDSLIVLSNMIVLYRPNVQQSLYLFLHKSSNLSYPQRYLPKYSLLINKCRSKKWAVLILEKPELTHKSKQILMYYWLFSNFLGIHLDLCSLWKVLLFDLCDLFPRTHF